MYNSQQCEKMRALDVALPHVSISDFFTVWLPCMTIMQSGRIVTTRRKEENRKLIPSALQKSRPGYKLYRLNVNAQKIVFQGGKVRVHAWVQGCKTSPGTDASVGDVAHASFGIAEVLEEALQFPLPHARSHRSHHLTVSLTADFVHVA